MKSRVQTFSVRDINPMLLELVCSTQPSALARADVPEARWRNDFNQIDSSTSSSNNLHSWATRSYQAASSNVARK